MTLLGREVNRKQEKGERPIVPLHEKVPAEVRVTGDEERQRIISEDVVVSVVQNFQKFDAMQKGRRY